MVDLELRAARPRIAWQRPDQMLGRLATWPLVAHVAVLYVGSRVVSTLLFLVTGATAEPTSFLGEKQGLLAQLLAWDGGWYQRIVVEGYPSVLPVSGGTVQPNAWAFLPLYPLTARALAFGNAQAWPVAAVLLSTACGLAATLLLAALVGRHGSRWQALTAAAVFAFGPTAYLLQTAYGESMGLALLFLLLLLVDARRYRWAMAVSLPLAFTRPGMQAVALFVGLHLVMRLVAARRGRTPISRSEVVHVLGLGALTGALGFIWPVIAGLVTGRPDAYLATEISWRIGYTGSAELGAFRPWATAFTLWFGRSGVLLLLVVLITTCAVLLSRRVRALGATIVLFGTAWFVYLLAVFYPQSSTFRLLMPAAPLAGALPVRSRLGLLAVIAVSVLLQGFWLYHGYGAPVTAWTAP